MFPGEPRPREGTGMRATLSPPAPEVLCNWMVVFAGTVKVPKPWTILLRPISETVFSKKVLKRY